jgi:urease accessory protein
MWCERVQRNIADATALPRGVTVDFIDLQWHECRQAMKTRTVGGEPVNILLPPGQRIRHGDVVYDDGQRMVIARVLPCEVVVARPRDTREMAVLAMELGNLHLTAEIGDGEIAFIQEPRAMDVLSRLSIPWTLESRRFLPTEIISAPSVVANGDLRVIRKRPTGVAPVSGDVT